MLSGNRNFEGRISQDVRANYLASPPLVVAYAIAGTVDIDLTTEPIGQDEVGNDVYLADIWPSRMRVAALVSANVTREQFRTQYANVFEGSDEWRAIDTAEATLFAWNAESTYVQEPPFFMDLGPTRPRSARSRVPAFCSSWATRLQQTTSRRPARLQSTRRPAST